MWDELVAAKWSVYVLSFYFNVSELCTREREACSIFFQGGLLK